MLLQELRHAARRLRRRPGTSALVIATMALGIGATTVLYSLIQGVLLSPLSWPDSDRLVRLAETREGATRNWPWTVTNATYLTWQEAASTVDGLAAWQRDSVTLSAQGEAERVRIAGVTASLFPLLRARPAHGALFNASEEATGGVVVLSHGLWQRRFGGSLDVLEESVRFDGASYRVIGVMPPEFAFPDREAQAWVPFEVPAVIGEDGNSVSVGIFGAMARLAPGVTPEQAAAEGTARGRGAPDLGMAAQAMFGGDGPPTITATPAREALTAEVRPALFLLLAAVGLLLATATANVAGLQLARAAAREKELALRSALGAGAGGLQRLLLIESGLLGALGGGAGLAFAWLVHRALPTFLPADFPRLDAVTLDWRVGLFALGLALSTGLLFGVLPVFFARRLSLSAAMTESGSGSLGGGAAGWATGRARSAILVGQVAVACILLLGGLQLGRSFLGQLAADRGYDTDNLLTARLPLPDSAYSAERRAEILEAVSSRLRAVPGVREVGFTGVAPLGGSSAMMTFAMPALGSGGGEVAVSTGIRILSPGYFAALGRRVIAGRPLSETDRQSGLPVVVVSRTFAERYLEGRGDAPWGLGALLPANLDGERVDWEVVGVVEDAVHRGLSEPAQPELFASYTQLGQGFRHPAPTILVRSSDRPEALVPVLRAAVREQDQAVALDSVKTMDQLLLGSLAQPRLYSILFGGFAACALAIAGVGLFALLSHAVTLRTREIGLRVALGAQRAQIIGLIGGQGLRLAGLGLILGLGASLLLARFAAGFLYGVEPYDPVGFVVVAAGLGLLALVASLVPVRHATAISPQDALRSE